MYGFLINLFIAFYIDLFMYVHFSVRDLDAKGAASRDPLSPLSLVTMKSLVLELGR